MYASNLKLINLRNHTNSFYELSNETLFIGENGSGKTTILEALYILFGLRSFKKQPLSSAVTFNEEFFRIESEIKDGSLISDAVCLFKNKRITMVNGEDIENIADYVYNHPVACYTPEMLGILSKDQQDRRNFIDRFIFYYDKEHIYDVKHYNVAAHKDEYKGNGEGDAAEGGADYNPITVIEPSKDQFSKDTDHGIHGDDHRLYLHTLKLLKGCRELSQSTGIDQTVADHSNDQQDKERLHSGLLYAEGHHGLSALFLGI